MAIFDSAQKEIQMNAPQYRGGKRLYKVFKNNKLVWQDRHTPGYSFSCWSVGEGFYFQINQNESVPYTVNYNCYTVHGFNAFAIEHHVQEFWRTISFAPGESGVKNLYVAHSADGVGYNAHWVRNSQITSVTLGDE